MLRKRGGDPVHTPFFCGAGYYCRNTNTADCQRGAPLQLLFAERLSTSECKVTPPNKKSILFCKHRFLPVEDQTCSHRPVPEKPRGQLLVVPLTRRSPNTDLLGNSRCVSLGGGNKKELWNEVRSRTNRGRDRFRTADLFMSAAEDHYLNS